MVHCRPDYRAGSGEADGKRVGSSSAHEDITKTGIPMVMEDLYYSKKLDRYFPTRLDYLLYAHDGRGLGHVSRTVAVGLALRRLDPGKKVLVISGSTKTGMLIGPAPLDWIKLPSYLTVLKDGVPTGDSGEAGYYKSVLGKLRTHMLESMVEILRPRCVLVDHNPMGKRKELLGALQKSRENDTQWVLGIRGIVGEDPRLWSEETVEAARDYRSILWYGDSRVLGTEQLDRLANHFRRDVQEVGYVSRLLELKPFITDKPGVKEEKIACTVSLPWLGESGEKVLADLQSVVGSIDTGDGVYHIYVSAADEPQVKEQFAAFPHCEVRQISDHYIASLLQSQSALICGGYNSLLDVAAAGVPAVIFLRSTMDQEQPEHLKKLQISAGNKWQVIDDHQLTAKSLKNGLQHVMNIQPQEPVNLRLDGAEQTALFLGNLVRQAD